ncbi:MAG: glycosyltransferase family 4 protein [Methanobacteriota archaeon]
MKIVLAARNALPFHKFCGTGRYVHGLAKHLVELGASVEIIAPPERDGRQIKDSADGINYRFIPPRVRGSRFFGFYRSYHLHNIRAARFISKLDFDVLHVFEINAFPYLLGRNRRPVVVSPFHRGTEPWKDGSLSARLSELPIDAPLSYLLKHAEAVASEGPTQTRRLIEKYALSPERVFEVPDGVDLDLIGEYVKEPVLSRGDVGLKDEDFVFICVGRLDPMKGVHDLIEAFGSVIEEIPDAKLVLIGEGSDEEKIRKMIMEREIQDKVVHAKDVSDRELFAYYSLSNVFVTPTIYEGLPQVILEAMACGLPIVATETGENTQAVENNVNGVLVPPENPDELAKALMRISNDSGKRMGGKSKELIKNYDWKNSAKKALKKYEELSV